MKNLLCASIAVVGLFGFAAASAYAGDYGHDPYKRTANQYVIKYVCGIKSEPGDALETQAVGGRYATAINILNANDDSTIIHSLVKNVFSEADGLHRTATPPDQPTAGFEAIDIACPFIRTIHKNFGETELPKGFNEGLVVLQSCKPLDINVVYTLSEKGLGPSIDVENVAGRGVRVSKDFCPTDNEDQDGTKTQDN